MRFFGIFHQDLRKNGCSRGLPFSENMEKLSLSALKFRSLS